MAAVITDSLETNFQLYPNPVIGLLNLRMSNGITGKVLINIFDAKGELVQSSTLEKDGVSIESAIDVTRLGRGVYVLQMAAGKNVRITRKFVKL
jgi:hypothetical protein